MTGSDRHGPNFIERIERNAWSNAKLATLLGGVWQSAMPEPIWKQAQQKSCTACASLQAPQELAPTVTRSRVRSVRITTGCCATAL
ncbi:DUF6869 domain-containing protein [Massilia sp. MP_M2]|uniref:DUF6869 domain-containing protein n=1 Tax=Massilia sp. MP_M2 TaxID=3071713 RepID=UPI00387E78A9